MSYSIRTLALCIAAIAVLLTLLQFPSAQSAYLVSVGFGLCLLVAIACAIGCKWPTRAFWIGFLVVSIFARYLDSETRLRRNGSPPISSDIADWLAPHLLHDALAPMGEPGSSDYRLTNDRRHVRYIVRGSDGRPERIGSMSLASAQARGITIKALHRQPEVKSFALIVRDLIPILLGLGGGAIAYGLSRRNSHSVGG
ncbi:hypothetical protein Q31a_04920 [Aureliella helgolandensis]|uniref:Uncharacterized protein n=1 Tax=Aureliella helgolandensis TaxID=2527968 RepID=A0A518G0S8_9BACT|nr:hypothetical protein Q31a_04920 [Aureliella helgolandensis]